MDPRVEEGGGKSLGDDAVRHPVLVGFWLGLAKEGRVQNISSFSGKSCAYIALP